MERHKDERKVRGGLDDDDTASMVATTSEATADSIADSLAEVEIDVEDGEEEGKGDLSAIKEEQDVPGKVARLWKLDSTDLLYKKG